MRTGKNDTNPKRKRGLRLIPSLALRVSMERLISRFRNRYCPSRSG